MSINNFKRGICN